MILKKTNNTKWVIMIGISLIVFSLLIYSVLKETPIPQKQVSISEKEVSISEKEVPTEKKNEIIVKETIVNDSLMKYPVNLTLRDSIVNFGMDLLGTPYVMASCSKDGFDCSGFVYFVFQNYNIKVPRSSIEFENFGKEIPIEDVKKGDILVFLSPTRNVIGHIGIVSNPKGKESDFIHASSGKEMKVVISSLSHPGYTRRFVKAVNVIDK